MLDILFKLLRATIMDFVKNVLPLLEIKLSVMLLRLVKRCKECLKYCTLSSTKRSGAWECAAPHGMGTRALERQLEKLNKARNILWNTIYWTNTMFPQTGKIIHYFQHFTSSPPLSIIFCDQVAACGEPAISHDSHHVSLVQWTNLFASRHKGHRFKSPGGTYVKPGLSC
jgi:hypothetical protein